jgi:hypothetical protein
VSFLLPENFQQRVPSVTLPLRSTFELKRYARNVTSECRYIHWLLFSAGAIITQTHKRPHGAVHSPVLASLSSGAGMARYDFGVSGTGPGKIVRRESVYAAGSAFLMSSIVTIPETKARSPNRRSAAQNVALHLGPQNRCGEPPRRGRNGCSHH